MSKKRQGHRMWQGYAVGHLRVQIFLTLMKLECCLNENFHSNRQSFSKVYFNDGISNRLLNTSLQYSEVTRYRI